MSDCPARPGEPRDGRASTHPVHALEPQRLHRHGLAAPRAWPDPVLGLHPVSLARLETCKAGSSVTWAGPTPGHPALPDKRQQVRTGASSCPRILPGPWLGGGTDMAQPTFCPEDSATHLFTVSGTHLVSEPRHPWTAARRQGATGCVTPQTNLSPASWC